MFSATRLSEFSAEGASLRGAAALAVLRSTPRLHRLGPPSPGGPDLLRYSPWTLERVESAPGHFALCFFRLVQVHYTAGKGPTQQQRWCVVSAALQGVDSTRIRTYVRTHRRYRHSPPLSLFLQLDRDG